MEKNQRAELKALIQKQMEQTQASIAELKELTKPISPENAIGRVSRMDAINNKSINDAALNQAKMKLEKLQFALEKCDDPEFGQCKHCNNPIPMGRLLLMPESLFCVRCA